MSPFPQVKFKAAYHQIKDTDLTKKLLAVRLYGSGHPTDEIFEIVDCSPTSLTEWVQKYQLDGLDSLKDQRQDRYNHHTVIPGALGTYFQIGQILIRSGKVRVGKDQHIYDHLDQVLKGAAVITTGCVHIPGNN